MTGKEKCELLKNLRKVIADKNRIEYAPEPCNFEGDCPGFCHSCEAEADYLLRELKMKEAAGIPVQVSVEGFEALMVDVMRVKIYI